MAVGRWIKRRGVRKLPSGAYLVTDDPEDEAEIFLEKRVMFNKGDVNDELEAYLKVLEPDLPVGQALTKRWGDERVQALLSAHGEAPDEVIPARVAKRDDGDGPAWRAIEKAARALVVKSGHSITFPEAVEQALAANPGLYEWYREDTME